MKIDCITVVIRTVGERTTEAAVQIAQNIFEQENVNVVKNVTPFSEAIRKAYTIGVNARKKWTLILDADVLLNEESIIKFVEDANQYSKLHSRIFCFTCMLDDKFLMKKRVVGGHLYRTKYLRIASRFISSGENDLRPETYIKRRMNAIGYGTLFGDNSVGLHDYFQSYKDIFRKGILHSKKHKDVDQLYIKWKAQSDQDKDFYWICKGVDAGEHIAGSVKVDAQYFEKYMQPYMQEFALQEAFSDWNKAMNLVRQKGDMPEATHFERIWPKVTLYNRMKNKLYEWWKK